jgi:hypothetical protein
MYFSFYFETFAEFPVCRGMKYAVLLRGQTEMHLYYVIGSWIILTGQIDQKKCLFLIIYILLIHCWVETKF